MVQNLAMAFALGTQVCGSGPLSLATFSFGNGCNFEQNMVSPLRNRVPWHKLENVAEARRADVECSHNGRLYTRLYNKWYRDNVQVANAVALSELNMCYATSCGLAVALA